MPLERIGSVEVDGRSYSIELVEAGVEVPIDHQTAVLDAKRRGSSFVVTHTEVPEPLRGKGIAEAMAAALLEYADRNSLTVQPYCPFLAKYIKRNPGYQRLVDPAFEPSRLT